MVVSLISTSDFSISPDCTSSTVFRPSTGPRPDRYGGSAVAAAHSVAAGSSAVVVVEDVTGFSFHWAGGSGVEKSPHVVAELLWVLVEEAVPGVGIDPQLGVRKMLGQKPAVLGMHHRVVVAVGDQRRLGDPGQAVELGSVRDAPGRDRRQLSVARGKVSRLIAVGLPAIEPLDGLHALGAALLRWGEEQFEKVVCGGLIRSREGIDLVGPAMQIRAALRRRAREHAAPTPHWAAADPPLL